MDKRVSVILTTKNAFGNIRKALDSLEKGGWSNLEVVISAADDYDYSSLKPLYPELRITQIPFSGIELTRGKAFSEAVKFSTGEYLMYMDAHDTVSEGYIDKMMSVALKTGSAFSDLAYINEEGKVVRHVARSDKEVSIRGLADAMGDFGFIGKREFFYNTMGAFSFISLIQLRAIGAYSLEGTTLVPDTLYTAQIHKESDSFTVKTINSNYEAIRATLESNPELLGITKVSNEFYEDCLEFYRVRKEVNLAYERMKERFEGLDYQEFIANNKVNYKRVGGKFSLDPRS